VVVKKAMVCQEGRRGVAALGGGGVVGMQEESGFSTLQRRAEGTVCIVFIKVGEVTKKFKGGRREAAERREARSCRKEGGEKLQKQGLVLLLLLLLLLLLPYTLQGEPSCVAQAVYVIFSAVDRYKELCEGKYTGEQHICLPGANSTEQFVSLVQERVACPLGHLPAWLPATPTHA
jgi:hypothetical protein